MKRIFWIRMVGLLSLFGWGLTGTLFWAGTTAPDATTRANVGFVMFLGFAGAFLLTLLWTLLSVAESLEHPPALPLSRKRS